MIECIPFGRTGHRSSRVIFGAAALGATSQERADAVLDQLRASGVNHLDTAAGYGDSELRLAPWLAAHPGEFFVATKTGARTGDGARAELERSLIRLGVDHVDLIQLHNLVEEDDWVTAHSPTGAVQALVKARDEGLVRAIGVTGHGLRIARMHLRSLERFAFDSVLVPYNYVLLEDDGYRSDVEELMAVCGERQVAVQTIKSIARRRWREDGARRFSWYEPLLEQPAIDRAVRYVLGNQQLFVNSSSDLRCLPFILAAANSAPALPPPTIPDLEADIETYAMRPLFDGAALERI